MDREPRRKNHSGLKTFLALAPLLFVLGKPVVTFANVSISAATGDNNPEVSLADKLHPALGDTALAQGALALVRLAESGGCGLDGGGTSGGGAQPTAVPNSDWRPAPVQTAVTDLSKGACDALMGGACSTLEGLSK